MSSEARFVLAIVLMLGVLVGTNILFPPAPPQEGVDPGVEVVEGDPEAAPPAEAPETDPADPPADTAEERATPPALPELAQDEELPTVEAPSPEDVPEVRIAVEGPLYRYSFSNYGASIRSAELTQFESFTQPGPVELIAVEDQGILGSRVVVSADTVDLRRLPFQVEPEGGLTLEEGGDPQTLTFTYQHPTEPFSFEVRYTFDPDSYVIDVSGRARGLDRGLLVSDLGRGLAFNEVDPNEERRSMAYVFNHLQNGIQSTDLGDVERSRLEEGPFFWAALKSRYFVLAAFPALEPGGAEYLGGLLAREAMNGDEASADVAVTQSLASGGTFAYRIYAGPQDYALLASMGNDFQQVNPIGWRPLRPILRPFVGAVMWLLVWLHETLAVGYGWVLIILGVMMRIVLFPLYHKAMKAQLRNMAVQPLLKEIQTKYKDKPEKMQKELMKLYKEHGFNPLAGCWPMLLPWPILIALFFVFQNTIELRGVPFAWLPDLSAKDPLFILPVLLGVSMFLIQWVSLRTMPDAPPQMRMMMWFLPIIMVVIFANFPSGLNLYYLTANVATLPQSWWIANERVKVKAKGPPEPAGA
ncbi:MAG: membrane protein insertase YidC [Gemmatimonadales bacterium]|nr:MAG: membrane protein insertase YidC [Gemmatimonadales bacterium]